MTVENTTARRPPASLLLALLLVFLCLLGTGLWQRFSEPELVRQVAHSPEQPAKDDMATVGRLMEEVSRNPENMDALLSLINSLMTLENWEAAENFARRGTQLAPEDPRPLHLLGVILHNTNRNAEAAQALEAVLKLHDDPSVRYSLGVLYIHYLEDSPRGVEHLRAGLALPNDNESLKQHIQAELDKAGAAPAQP